MKYLKGVMWGAGSSVLIGALEYIMDAGKVDKHTLIMAAVTGMLLYLKKPHN